MSHLEPVNQEILETRAAMMKAGWRFAVDDLPGAYLPTAEATGITKPSDWIIDAAKVLDKFAAHCDDRQFLDRMKAEFARPAHPWG